ncbi:MAG: DNA repair protein RecN [Clostridiales bacterium]|nr:DNA repair protein RecN [Clostridiales bacterium]
MLLSMTVRNIALIEYVHIDFHQGLHVLTGETGAGKSIVVDSINLVLGERADRSLIRSGCEKASVEALLDISGSPQVQELLASQSLQADGNMMPIQREITVGDRNLCRVCGVIVPLAFLKQISALLVDIHGQHEHQSLLDVKNHISFLDSFGDEKFQAQQAKVAELYHVWKQSSQAYSALRKESNQRDQRLAYISSRVKELQTAHIEAGEAEKLAAERARYIGAEKINSALEMAYHAVLAGDGTQNTATLRLKTASDAMHSITEFDERYQALAERLSSAYYEVEELGLELRDILAELNFDPDRNEAVQERLDLIRRLERRFGMPADELIGHAQELTEEFNRLQSMDDRLKHAEVDYKSKLLAYRQEAAVLTEMRKALAHQFEGLMEGQLKDLGMAQTHFECVFTPPVGEDRRIVPSENGDDHVEFFIAPNLGEPLKPLGKTASGGELSRLMLALKTAGASRNLVPCMIFDEVDTGISGLVASVVAEKMAQIAHYRQVICVTHLAQIAAMADYQYQVEKHVVGDRTVTNVIQLDHEQRVAEIARLLGSVSQNAQSGFVHARSMLSSAQEYKHRHTQ